MVDGFWPGLVDNELVAVVTERTVPPVHLPLRRLAAILSLTRRRQFPLELGKGQQHVEGQPSHGCRSIELLGDGDERD